MPHNISLRARRRGEAYPLFFCNQKKSRKTVKEKFRPLPSRSRVRLPPKGGINAPPETVWFLISTASPTGSRAVFQYPSDARPPKALRASRGYYFDNSTKGAYLSRRLSRGWCGASGYRRRAQILPRCVPRLSPPGAGCPHPSRRSAAPRHLPQGGRQGRLRRRAQILPLCVPQLSPL